MVVLIGVISAVLTSSCWAPQLRRTLRRGTASDFAWPYLVMLGTGGCAWCAYGVLRADPVIVVANVLVTGSVLIVVVVKLRSRRLTIDELELTIPAGGDTFAALESLVAVGPRLARDLQSVGISDAPTLRAVGIEEANRRLVDSGLQTGTHSRQAIAGAIAGEWTAEVKRPGGRSDKAG
jgi:MtN3 and saliva related transmembrane protein